MTDLATPLANAIQALLHDQPVAYVADGQARTVTLSAHTWTPSTIRSLPAIVIHVPRIERRNTDEQEAELGTRSFLFTFPVDLLLDIAPVGHSEPLAVAAAHTIIDLVDASSPPVGGALDTVVTAFTEPELVTTPAGRDLMRYPATIEVLKLAA